MSKQRSRSGTQEKPAVKKAKIEPVLGNGETAVVQPGALPTRTGAQGAPAGGMTPRALVESVTVEVAAYVLIFAAALLLRVVGLDARPLAPAEAQTAAAAWEFLNGKPIGAFVSPLLITLDWVTFFLFGAFDVTARLLPAFLGALLVGVPALARGALGRTGAIVAAVLIAFSPLLVFFGRTLWGVDLAVGAATAALLLFWRYRELASTRALYAAAALAALALTADGAAYSILLAGALYFILTGLWDRRNADTAKIEPNTRRASAQKPIVRAVILFAAVYVLTATTFLLNRDGLGVAFNLLGAWLGAIATIGSPTTPLSLLLAYEPLTLIFGLAGVVLALSLRRREDPKVGLLQLLSIVSIFAFVWYSLAEGDTVADAVAVTLPLVLMAGWFIGNLLERAVEDLNVSGGWRATLAGELPVLLMLLFLAVLVYLQLVTFLQQARFAPTVDIVYRVLGGIAPESAVTAAALALGLITILLFGVIVGLSILLVGVARTTTLLAVLVLILLGLGMLRATWLLNFSTEEPLHELAAPSQSTLAVRDLVRDLEWHSQWRYGDGHVIKVVATPDLGATGRWYLRAFPNLTWTGQPDRVAAAQALVTGAGSPPPGDWQGQRYRVGVTWEPGNLDGLDLWKWFVLRQGGVEHWETLQLWLPIENQLE